MNLKNKKIIISVLVLLVVLNGIAFYCIRQSIGVIEALQKVQDQHAVQSLQQKSLIYNSISAVVITLDLLAILFGLYLLHKFIFKTLKKSISTKS